MALGSYLERVTITNFKSIAACSVELRPLTFLVGPNGSGKSNFLDALRFVSDCLQWNVARAIQERRGMRSLVRQGEDSFTIKLNFVLANGRKGHWFLEVRTDPNFDFFIQQEECNVLLGPDNSDSYASYRSRGAEWPLRADEYEENETSLVLATKDAKPFIEVRQLLKAMAFYRVNPAAMRQAHLEDVGRALNSDGSNAASVWSRLTDRYPDRSERLMEYLTSALPETTAVHTRSFGGLQTLEFAQRAGDGMRQFPASSVSDGSAAGAKWPRGDTSCRPPGGY
jgi:predicted ATPase